MDRLFGTSGIRGPADSFFTNQFCFDVGRSFALFLDKHASFGKVAVGMDPRVSSQRIKEYFCAGLSYEKRQVFDEGIVPVPAMNWLLISSDFTASAMITGSHIKSDLNGLKFFAFKEEILKEHEEEIKGIYESLMEEIPFPHKIEALLQDNQAETQYKEMLMILAEKPYPNWKIVVDTGNGAQRQIIPNIAENLGINVVSLNNDSFGDFLARDTEAEEDFGPLKQKVQDERADLGVGFDADGDRVIFIDKNGRFIPGEYSSLLIATHEKTDSIVATFNVSQAAEQIGKKVYRTKVGSPYVVGKMKETGAMFGFEANGGCIFGEIMFTRDGGTTAIKMMNILKQTGKGLDELIDDLPRFFLFKDKIDCPWEKDEAVYEAVKKEFAGNRLEELDGLKVWPSKNSWILFRSSQNAPEFRVFAEAPTQKEATKLGENGIQLVKRVISS